MEGISALMDGELEDQEAQRELARIRDDQDLRRRWEDFHLVRDALRNEPLLSASFSETLSRRLALEPTVLAPRRVPSPAKRMTTYALSAAASLSAVALVAWVALAPTVPLGPQAGVSKAPVTAAAIAPTPQLASVPSEGRMNEYLLAHQGFSPSTALQGLAPYIRSVSAIRSPESR